MMLDSITYSTEDEAERPSNVHKWGVDLLQTDTSGSQEPVATAIERLNREIARVLHVEALLLGSDGKGSLALSKDKTHALLMMIDGTLDELAETTECDVLDPWLELNGIEPELKPTLKTEAVQFRDVEQITGALADLAQAGAMLDPEDEAIAEVRDLLGLSRPVVVLSAADAQLATDLRPQPSPKPKPAATPRNRSESETEEVLEEEET